MCISNSRINDHYMDYVRKMIWDSARPDRQEYLHSKIFKWTIRVIHEYVRNEILNRAQMSDLRKAITQLSFTIVKSVEEKREDTV